MEGISFTGYTLNNSMPCLSYSGRAINTYAHTRGHTQKVQDILRFSTYYVQARGRGCSVGLGPERWIAKYSDRKWWGFSRHITWFLRNKNVVGLVILDFSQRNQETGNGQCSEERKNFNQFIWSDKEQLKSPKMIFNNHFLSIPNPPSTRLENTSAFLISSTTASVC